MQTISRFRSLPRRFRVALAYSRALALRRTGRYAEAIARLDKAYSALGLKAPSASAPILVNLVRANLCLQTGLKLEAYEASAAVIDQLHVDPPTGRQRPYGKSERDYLLYACKYIAASTSPFVDSVAFGLARSIPLTHEDIDFFGTQNIVKRALWMTPAWAAEFDAWFLQNELLCD